MKYKRILLKLSGEILGKAHIRGIDHEQLIHYVKEIKSVYELGVEIAIVVGGGNIHRGKGDLLALDRAESDKIGMLATVMNGIALHRYLESHGVASVHFSSFCCPTMVPTYARDDAIQALDHGKVVLITGGLGLPYFTTDTAASLRGIELQAEVLLKATDVDGIYNIDPKLDDSAFKFNALTFQEAIEKDLSILDKTAFVLCQTYRLDVLVFNVMLPGTLRQILLGDCLGTMVREK